MFDIAFSELVVICVVALIVIGPEKLPKFARTLGALTGRVQNYVTQIKEEVNREARFTELQKLQDEIQSAANAKQQALRSEIEHVTEELNDLKYGTDVTKRQSISDKVPVADKHSQ